ncbi:MAG: type IV toxin-antitoxin system AbiEi family antitoxin domain-containing protein [Euryarchaeota archaeon]|nr:type IV toxin-antitoxin system AbiEi family antitoxin domain-containing protein [Euryarchaeota archaeon]
MNIDLLRAAFPSSEFSTREASAALGTSTATTRTLLNELRTKGLLIRTGRGRYRVAPDSNRAALDRRRIELRLEHALEAPLRIGLDGPDAVSLWTRGRYTVRSESTAIHIAVAADDEKAYRKYLDEIGLPIGEEYRRPHVALRVVPEPCFTVLEGKPVLDREAVLAFIHDNPITYDGADEWLVKT